jgi:RNA polymerase sigma factor (sigma-70 family)
MASYINTEVVAAIKANLQLVELIEGMAQGDERSMESFYEATLGRIYGLALRITKSPFMAEEVVSDVYMQIWRSASTFDVGRGSPIGWVLTICRSRALDHVRALGPTANFLNFDDLVDLSDNGTCDPQDLLIATQENHVVHEALNILDPRDRQLVSLSFFRGLSHAEISEHMALPLGTVKSCLRRALLTIRAVMNTQMKDRVGQ